ncbi:ABC transporter permease [Bacteroides caecigallinarum]|uniref:ABC transporter permease n=1 Tax=Bacteroides caecigallinarum TaxID=1411144 RepID=UPI0019581006|nr:ABC transporter permease [Bacteroides caecigallinarum]MBM6888788.1 ABC transporter permease [Bacteroides caecigallinarum]MCF2553084.1 ABC transporter permease [Bacteroides caecigallinarum]
MLWKLLKQHISVAQLTGFFIANLCGMVIVMLGVQFYNDVSPVFNEEDSFIKKDYVVVTKKVSTLGSISGKNSAFSSYEVDNIKSQPFAVSVGKFQPARFKVSAGLSFAGMSISTAMFLESVPDNFVDVKADEWKYVEGQGEIPIIIPRNYLNLYNFGFARSRNLPQLSEGMIGMVSLNLYISGNGMRDMKKGRIVGFSNRLNTILVPEDFMNAANSKYGDSNEMEPSRVIIEVDNPADERIAHFFNDNGYETEDNKLDAGKITWFLKIAVGIVMAIGLVISALSFYILLLSIYLLLQKNTDKLENLILIGYSASSVSMPYQILTVAINFAVLVIAVFLLIVIRGMYSGVLSDMIQGIDDGRIVVSCMVGVILFLFVSAYNIIAIRRKVNAII